MLKAEKDILEITENNPNENILKKQSSMVFYKKVFLNMSQNW